MSHVGLGANVINGPGYFQPPDWPWDYGARSVHDGRAHRPEPRHHAGRCGRPRLESQRKAKVARDEGRFKREILPIDAPVLGDDGEAHRRDRARRARSGHSRLHGGGPGEGSSRCSRAASTRPGTRRRSRTAPPPCSTCRRRRPEAMGLKPRARIVFDVLVGTDPYYLLDGPVDATRIPKKTGMSIATTSISTRSTRRSLRRPLLGRCLRHRHVEGERERRCDRVGPSGGRHGLAADRDGAPRARAAGAWHGLRRMCCGAAVGTGTIIERL